MKFPFNWYNKFGTIPSSYREAMSYEEQILWLCQQIEELKLESSSYNYNMLENKPSINGVTLQGNINASQLGLDNYNYLLNKPAINGVTLLGNKSLSELGIQEKLVAGTGIRIIGNTISATGGGTGGSSDYNDLYNKPSMNGIILAGDLTGREAKLQDSLINDRSQDINNNFGKVAYLANYQVNDIIPKEIPELSYANASYITFNVAKGSYIDVFGNYDLYKIKSDNKLQLISSTNGETTGGSLDVLSDGIVVINFFDVGNYNPTLKEYMSGESITQDFEELDKEIEHNSYDLNTFLKQNYDFESLLSSAQEGLFTEIELNNPLPQPSENSSSRYIKIAKSLNYSCIFDVVGTCNGSYMWFTTEDRSGTEYITSLSELNMIKNGYVEVDIPENADYIYFQFTNYNSSSNVLNGLKITEIEGGGGGTASIAELTSPIILTNNQEPTLESGLYLVGAGIYIGSAAYTNVVFSYGEIIYYKANSKKFYGDFNIVEQIEGTWSISQNERIDTTTLSNSRDRIPSSLAVQNAIQNVNPVHKILNDIVLENNTTPTLETGIYVLYADIYFGSATSANLIFGRGETIYYDSSIKTFSGDFNIAWQLEGIWNYQANERIDVTTLSNTSEKIPSSLAVHNALQNVATKISTDLLLENNVTPTLESGLYLLTNSGIYIGSIVNSNLMFGSGEIVYYDSSTKTFYGSCFNVQQDSITGTWSYEANDKIDFTTMTNRDNKFPTSLAVYNAIPKDTMQFTLTAGSTFNVSNTTFTPINYDMASNLSGNAFVTFSNGNITFTRSGVYLVSANSAFNNNQNGSRYQDFIRYDNNKAVLANSTPSCSDLRTNLSGSGLFVVTEEDISLGHNVYQHRAYQSSGTTLELAANGTLVQICRISDFKAT